MVDSSLEDRLAVTSGREGLTLLVRLMYITVVIYTAVMCDSDITAVTGMAVMYKLHITVVSSTAVMCQFHITALADIAVMYDSFITVVTVTAVIEDPPLTVVSLMLVMSSLIFTSK